MEVPISTMNNIVNYLARQPYKDVAGLIGAVLEIQKQPEPDQKELPLGDHRGEESS